MNIHQFTRGDLITRTEPVYVKQQAEYNSNLGISVEPDPIASFNFVGQKLIFRGLVNGGINIHVVGGYSYHLPLHKDHNINWNDGWELYEEPMELDHEPEKEPEKPKRDWNWLWVAYAMAAVAAIGALGPTSSETIWVMVVLLMPISTLCAIWHYFPKPDWRD